VKTEHARLRTLGFALLLVVLAGCTSYNKDVMRFNDHMAQSNKKLASAAYEFRQTFAPLGRNEFVDAAPVKAAYQDVRAVLSQIREERSKLKYPKNPALDAMNDAYEAFLDGQERIVDQDFPRIIAWVEAVNLTPANKWEKIGQEFTRIQDKERADYQKLFDAQQKFAVDVDMKLIFQ
jgi:hypothetical protein